MRRTKPLSSSKILPRRELMRSTPLVAKSPMKKSAGPIAKSPMRRKSRSRSTPATKSAREQDCTLQFPGCRNDTSTVVLCHLRMFGGGGVALKPSSAEAVFGCFGCHQILDGRVPWVRDDATFNFWEAIARAIVRTQRVMMAEGLLVFKGEAA